MSSDEDLIRELRRRARARVKVPAGFLLAMAALGGCLAVFVLLLSTGVLDGPRAAAEPRGGPVAQVIALFGLAWCGFIGYGAWEMDRLGNYQIARAAAWVAVIPVPIPLYLLWLVGAILGLIALNDPAVRAAFASGNGFARAVYLEDHGDQLRQQMSQPRTPARG